MTRSEVFGEGAASAQSPQFATVQSQHARNFQAMSVLDLPAVRPNQNGMGTDDLKRRTMGLSAESPTGRSQSTFEDQAWIRPQHQVETTARRT